MGELGLFLVPMTLFISGAAVLIFRGPLGKAIGERIAGRSVAVADPAESEALHHEIDELRYRLSEVEERLDFTDRLLSQSQARNKLGER